MLNKEEFKKELIRVWDSVRSSESKGCTHCFDVDCNICPIKESCRNDYNVIWNAYSIVEAVEKWSEEHPIKTNREVMKELLEKTFGNIFFDDYLDGCKLIDCHKFSGEFCDKCEYKGFWDKEYKERKYDESKFNSQTDTD